MNTILVFKTNILEEDDVMKVTSSISKDLRIKRWTVDCVDCDKVLRVESNDMLPDEVIELIQDAGYSCEELTY
jgi:hypothetical protein